MVPTISREQARELDRRAVSEYGMHGLQLMENAGRGVADELCRRGVGGAVVIACGGGNNGGDGFVIARHLDLRGHKARVLLAEDPATFKGDALVNFRIVSAAGIHVERFSQDAPAAGLAGAVWIIDALLGTGARGEPRGLYAQLIRTINEQRAAVLAVDIPSGFDCDSGVAADNTIRAALTCTFVAAKPGFLRPHASAYTGPVHVVDIGAPRRLVAEVLGR